jgi:hypothetical protein
MWQLMYLKKPPLNNSLYGRSKGEERETIVSPKDTRKEQSVPQAFAIPGRLEAGAGPHLMECHTRDTHTKPGPKSAILELRK